MMTLASLFLFYASLTSSGNVAGVSAAAEPIDEMPSPRNLSFFGMFATEYNRHKFDGPLDCVYGDAVKGAMCPPVMKDPMAHLKASEGRQNVLEVFSRCLDDPDDPDCRELQVGEVSPSSQVAQAPAHLRNLFGATLSPTTDDWCVFVVPVGSFVSSGNMSSRSLLLPLSLPLLTNLL